MCLLYHLVTLDKGIVLDSPEGLAEVGSALVAAVVVRLKVVNPAVDGPIPVVIGPAVKDFS